MGRLEGATALVTGGGRGIGLGIARVLSREGAKVAIADINFGDAARAAAEIEQAGQRALAFDLDVTDAVGAVQVVQRIGEAFGGLSILVNNAGILGERGGRDVTLADWDRAYEVNLKGAWIVSRAVIPALKERGGGKIVNVASIAARRGGGPHPHYAASKAGVVSLTQSLATELGPHNINVNAVCPGLVRTEMWSLLERMVGREGFIDEVLASRCPLRREQTPEDIGNAVAFLASEEARNITGQALNVDGGIEMD